MKRFLFLAAFLILSVAPNALAVQPDEVMADPVLEARARALSKELRCMVCQNQSIDDSDAPLARDLRLLVRERLKGGDTDQQVIDFLVVRYGEFVLLKPQMSWHTAILWLGPPTVLLAGALVLLLFARRRARGGLTDAAKPEGGILSPAEQAQLARIMNSPDD